MKCEGQLWIGFFAMLFRILLATSFCGVLAGKVDEGRAKAAAAEKAEVGEPAGVRDRGDWLGWSMSVPSAAHLHTAKFSRTARLRVG